MFHFISEGILLSNNMDKINNNCIGLLFCVFVTLGGGD